MWALALFLAASPDPDLPRQAQSVLRARCYRCHGANGEAEHGIDVTDVPDLIAIGVIEPGDPDRSPLVRVVEKGRMPLKGRKLTASETAILRRWVQSGASQSGASLK